MEEMPTQSNSSMSFSSPSQEESGWSIYIEDFLASEKRKASSTITTSCSSSISSDDATSFVAPPKKVKRKRNMISFKNKTEGGELHDDDSLKDTATSSITNTSHKATKPFTHLDIYQRKKHNKENISDQEKGLQSMELQREGRDEIECSELRKRGLCLVPVSMVLEHLGQ